MINTILNICSFLEYEETILDLDATDCKPSNLHCPSLCGTSQSAVHRETFLMELEGNHITLFLSWDFHLISDCSMYIQPEIDSLNSILNRFDKKK